MKWEYFLNGSIWLIDGILTDTTIPGQREPGNNSNDGVMPYILDLKKLSLTIKFSGVPYSGHPFLGVYILREVSSFYKTGLPY